MINKSSKNVGVALRLEAALLQWWCATTQTTTTTPNSAKNNAISVGLATMCAQPISVSEYPPVGKVPPAPLIADGTPDLWTWSAEHKSHETCLHGEDSRVAHFHAVWSGGTAGVRGNKPLNPRSRYYWEIQWGNRVFGTSMMVGIGTKHQRLHVDKFIHLLGEDQHGWGLSHKGTIWHNGDSKQYTRPFIENQPTLIGVYFDGHRGTLSFLKNGVFLGVAFRDLDKVTEPLYPIVCSTAAKTEMTLMNPRRSLVNLQDHCRAKIIRYIRNCKDVEQLELSRILVEYLKEDLPAQLRSLPHAATAATTSDLTGINNPSHMNVHDISSLS